MARRTTSPWRQQSRRVIMDVLILYRMNRSPPWDADAERAIVSAAYPFGERKNHPYRMWLAEVKHALGGNPRKPHDGRIRITPDGVLCHWCGGKMCLVCLRFWQRWGKVKDWSEWRRWEAAIAATPWDIDLRLVFADWLEEQGFEDQAELYRQVAARLKAGIPP